MRALQFRDVELGHLQHGIEDTLRGGAIGSACEFAKDPRNDLPGYAELVGDPAAAIGLAALAELFPQPVDFGLVLARNIERDSGTEFVLRPAIQDHEFLALDLKRAAEILSVRTSANRRYLGAFERQDIETDG